MSKIISPVHAEGAKAFGELVAAIGVKAEAAYGEYLSRNGLDDEVDDVPIDCIREQLDKLAELVRSDLETHLSHQDPAHRRGYLLALTDGIWAASMGYALTPKGSL